MSDWSLNNKIYDYFDQSHGMAFTHSEDIEVIKEIVNSAMTMEIKLLNNQIDHLERNLNEYVVAAQRLAIERAEFRQENERLKAPASLESERARFENWMSDGGKWPRAIGKDSSGNYLLMQSASYWMVWQTAMLLGEEGKAQPALRIVE